MDLWVHLRKRVWEFHHLYRWLLYILIHFPNGSKVTCFWEIQRVSGYLDKSNKIVRSELYDKYHLKIQGILEENGEFLNCVCLLHLNTRHFRKKKLTLLDMTRSMIDFSTLPISFYGCTMGTAAYILNLIHSKFVPKTS